MKTTTESVIAISVAILLITNLGLFNNYNKAAEAYNNNTNASKTTSVA